MRAGQLRHRCTFQRATITRDDHGQEIRSFAKIRGAWARIQPVDMREEVDGGGTEQSVTHTVTVRHFDGLLPTDRFLYGSRTFNLQPAANPGERNIMLKMKATEVL